MPLSSDAEIHDLLSRVRTIAMVGASQNPERASYRVMRYLIGRGYRVIPVNPAYVGEQLHGETVIGSLFDIDVAVDMVDIFRKSDAVGPIVDDAIAIGAKSVWMQLGVIDEVAAKAAEAAGLLVVMDHCPKIEIPRLGVPKVS